MQRPLQIVFRDLEPSAALESRIRERVAKLEQLCHEIIGCRVVIELRHRHHHQGALFHVGIALEVPHAELVSSRGPDVDHAHEDVYVAVRDAFAALRTQLDEYVAKRRGQVKHEERT
jgi:ribosome-associated translation inhibitor RaiA